MGPASLLLLAAGLWPGVRLVQRSVLIPDGETARTYDRLLVDAMTESQRVAAVVAERAAGLRVPLAPERIYVFRIVAGSRAAGILHEGDRIVRVNGRPIGALADVPNAADALPRGSARVGIERAGQRLELTVPTVRTKRGVRMGILVREQGTAPVLPVPVRFAVGDISGSSAGLMFALAIYASLRGGAASGPPIAGTGTLSPDGRVGPIEGTRQKLIAARRAGATVFLVPRENYDEVKSESGLRVVPVGSFAEALRAIGA